LRKISEDTDEGLVATLGKLVEFVRLDPAVFTNLSLLDEDTRFPVSDFGDGGSKYPDLLEFAVMAMGGVIQPRTGW
jgi:hypothetical protein